MRVYQAFLSVYGQWRTVQAGLGGVLWIGLDYAAVDAGLRRAEIALSSEDWADFQEIEAGAALELNRKR
jgi:hypothetical protein